MKINVVHTYVMDVTENVVFEPKTYEEYKKLRELLEKNTLSAIEEIPHSVADRQQILNPSKVTDVITDLGVTLDYGAILVVEPNDGTWEVKLLTPNEKFFHQEFDSLVQERIMNILSKNDEWHKINESEKEKRNKVNELEKEVININEEINKNKNSKNKYKDSNKELDDKKKLLEKLKNELEEILNKKVLIRNECIEDERPYCIILSDGTEIWSLTAEGPEIRKTAYVVYGETQEFQMEGVYKSKREAQKALEKIIQEYGEEHVYKKYDDIVVFDNDDVFKMQKLIVKGL
jgi:hypothetical protein